MTIIIPVLIYGSETWTSTKAENTLIPTFKRKILREIYGTMKQDNNVWRHRYNFELLNRGSVNGNIVTTIKTSKLRWTEHVVRYIKVTNKANLCGHTNRQYIQRNTKADIDFRAYRKDWTANWSFQETEKDGERA